jgi:hypothetical protein
LISAYRSTVNFLRAISLPRSCLGTTVQGLLARIRARHGWVQSDEFGWVHSHEIRWVNSSKSGGLNQGKSCMPRRKAGKRPLLRPRLRPFSPTSPRTSVRPVRGQDHEVSAECPRTPRHAAVCFPERAKQGETHTPNGICRDGKPLAFRA